MKANASMFKLRDPKTKLFWVNPHADNPRFNTTGKHWGTRKSAMKNWAEYQYQRILKEDDHPDLELVEYEVAVTEKEKGQTATNSIDMTMPAKVAAVLGNRAGPYSLDSFLRNLAEQGKFMAAYIVEAKSQDPFDLTTLPIPRSITCLTTIHDTFKRSHLFMALKSFTDLTFVKMVLSENIVAIYDIGEIIAQYDSGVRSKVRSKEGKF